MKYKIKIKIRHVSKKMISLHTGVYSTDSKVFSTKYSPIIPYNLEFSFYDHLGE